MEIKKASRKQVKLRMGLSGTAGSGKTKSALRMAFGMTNDWSKIGVIDTENDSASLYADMGEFNTLSLTQPYTPERYTEAIKMMESAGIEVLIIDSITHEWDGSGGCLEIVEKLGGRYQDWGKVTPRHQAFIDSILNSKCHVITTVRRKQDYEMTKENGKTTVTKLGLKEVTREGFEYELTLNMNIEQNHLASASKDRTGMFVDKPEFVITEETGKKIMDWCNTGVDPKEEIKATIEKIEKLLEGTDLFTPDEKDIILKDIDKKSLEWLNKNYGILVNSIAKRELELKNQTAA